MGLFSTFFLSVPDCTWLYLALKLTNMESGFWDYLGGQKYAATSAGVSREVIFGLNLSLVQSSKPEECSSADQIYKKNV